MQIHNSTYISPTNNTVLTIGSFDGVHLGHKKIIEIVQKEAVGNNGEAVVITFEPHPRTITQPNALLHIITTASEKVQLLTQFHIAHLVVYPFSTAFAELSAEAYIEDFIIKKFAPKIIVIGYDHHFGKNRDGNIKMLAKYAAKGFFKLIEIEEQTIQQAGISSTKIRNALLYGEIEKANQLLGYAYFFTGTVVKGKQLGRTIGFKTANLQLQHNSKLIPGNGVYVVQVQWDNLTLQGMMNIGTRPTVDGTNRTIEVHILNFDAEIYDEELSITILSRLRNEQKFDGLISLKHQLEKDKLATIHYFKSL
jgi:riboflavin kinase/FMN adenylyltransferase